MEANLAEIEAGRARARVLAAQREATSARLELQRLTGILPDREVRLLDEVPAGRAPTALDPDSLISLALARRPDLAAHTRAVDQAETLTGLARREAIPNVRIGVFVERDALAYRGTGLPGAPVGSRALESPRIGLGVSLPVPLFDRNQGEVAERKAQAQQARLRRAATELAVRTQVTDAYRAYLAASEEARVFARDVLQPARTNQQLLEAAFRAGKVGLPTLVLLRNQLLDAELGYWDAWLSERRALVALEAATATLDLNLNPSEDR
jgi:cobalt-zinc-cadmium efflux system outer membrane protein